MRHTQPFPTAEPGHVAQAVMTGLCWMGVLTWLFLVPAAMGPVVSVDLSLHGHLSWPTWLLLSGELLVFLGLCLPPLGIRSLMLSGAMVIVAVVGSSPWRQAIDPLHFWAPGHWIIAWTAWSLLKLDRRRRLAANIAVGVVLILIDVVGMVVHGIPLTRLNLTPTIWIAVPIANILLFGQGLLSMANLVDRQEERRRDAEKTEAEERSESEGRREAARILHDHVLHALHALSRDSTQVSLPMVQDECRQAINAVEATRSPSGLARDTTRLEDELALDPLLATLGTTVQGTTEPMPLSVARAMVAAAHEALSNVRRHARAEACLVQVEQDEGQWRIIVSDDGRGFDQARLPVGRLGLRRSVHERLEDLGGVAHVSSHPGHGTRVELAWPVTAEATSPWPAAGSALMRRAMRSTVGPDLAVALATGLLTIELNHDWWILAVAASIATAVVLFFRRKLLTAPLTGTDIAVVLATALAVWMANLWVTPTHPSVAYQLWLGYLVAAMLHLTTLQMKPRHGLVVLAGMTTLLDGSLILRTSWHDFFRVHTALSLGIGECGVGLLVVLVASRLVAQNEEQAREIEMNRRSTSRIQIAAHVESYWSQRVTGVAMPLLQSVAESTHQSLCPDIRTQARVLEATLRDELVLGPNHAALLASLQRARQAGWQVNSSLSPEQDPKQLRRFAHLLDIMGGPAATQQVLNLSATAAQGVALVLNPTPEQVDAWQAAAESENVRLDLDPDFVRIRLPFTAQPATPPLVRQPA